MYKTIAIAGTFDRLHKGHEFYILEAFKLGEKVVIGVTSDEYVKVKISNKIQIQNFQTRKKELEKYLKQEKLLNRAQIIAINDLYGPSIRKNDIEALAVTSDTLEGARLVNGRRRERGLKLLKILKIPIVLAQDNRKISSTRIRLGQIDRMGRLYSKLPVWGKAISEAVRISLKQPIGELVVNDSSELMDVGNKVKEIVKLARPYMIITVGDQVTKLCNQIGIKPQLSIFDFKVKRKKIYRSIHDLGYQNISEKNILIVGNPAGYITNTLVDAIRKSLNAVTAAGEFRLVQVLGEDDLAGVPAIIFSPLNSIVCYGQPDRGVVIVEVTERIKEELIGIIAGTHIKDIKQLFTCSQTQPIFTSSSRRRGSDSRLPASPARRVRE